MPKAADTTNTQSPDVEVKVQAVVNPFEAELEARKKEGSLLFPKIHKLVTTFGVVTDNGYSLEKDGVKLFYNELMNQIVVEHGATVMFAASVPDSRVVIYRRGSWERIFMSLYKEWVEDRSPDFLASKQEQRLRAKFGIPLPR